MESRIYNQIIDLQKIFEFDTQHMIVTNHTNKHNFYDILKLFTKTPKNIQQHTNNTPNNNNSQQQQVSFIRTKKYCHDKSMFLEIITNEQHNQHNIYHRQHIYKKDLNDDGTLTIDVVRDIELPMYHFPGLLTYDTIEHSIVCNIEREQLNISFQIITVNGVEPKYLILFTFKCNHDVSQTLLECLNILSRF